MMDPLLARLLLSMLAFGAALLILVGAVGVARGPLMASWRRGQVRDARVLDALFLHRIGPVELWTWIGVVAVAAALAIYALSGSGLLALLIALAVPWMRGPFFAWLRERRLQRFEEQLPGVLDLLASSARSGLSLPQCVEEVARRGQPPASQELGLILRDMRLAAGPRAAIQTARERIGSRPFNLVASALTVSLEKGGNLPETLERISRSLKELWRLEQKIITASAEGRKAVRFITIMPILLFFMISGTQPELIEALVGNLLGWIVLLIAATLYGVGLFWVRRILAVSV